MIVTSLFLPASVIMYASGSPQNSDESDSGSADDDDASDDGSMEMDDASDDGSMDDASDDGSMDDASDDGSMDDMSDSWSMEKSNNALNPEPTGGTNDGLSPLTSGPTSGTNDGLSPLTSGPTGGTNDGLSPLTSGPTTTGPNAALRVESNSTGNVTGGDFAKTILADINQERALVGVPPLTWDNTLAADAQTYADYLASTGKMEHPSQAWVDAHPTVPEGENLAYIAGVGVGASSPTSLAQGAFDFWFSEKANYHGQPTGSEGGVVIGHYTQMVWKSTTKIGCASATSGDGNAVKISCRFAPPGNIIGQTPY